MSVYGEDLFGELAVARLLDADGWSAVWADTFHGKFWDAMPHKTAPTRLSGLPLDVYTSVTEKNGGAGGCFDVVAWSHRRVVFVEYKGPGDRPNKNEARWIDAALSVGVSGRDLLLVGEKARPNTF